MLSLAFCGNSKEKDKEQSKKNGDIFLAFILYNYLNPRFTYSCDYIVGSGICYNLNTNAAAYNCTGTVSTSPCACNGLVVGSCRRTPSITVYYNNVYNTSTATSNCTAAGGTFTTSCLTQ